MTHFFVVYLPAEAICNADVETEVLGLPLVSALTLSATAVALAAIAETSRRAFRRWKSTGVGWGASETKPSDGPVGGAEHDGELALAGFLMGVLFALAILFVGLPAAVLSC